MQRKSKPNHLCYYPVFNLLMAPNQNDYVNLSTNKISMNNFGTKRSGISSRLTELKIFFYYPLQAKKNSLK